MNNLRYLANLEIALALAGWAAGLWGVWRGDAAIRQYLYFFAWYPYIVFLDGLLFRLRGRSWLLTQPRKFLRMFGWSVTVWLIFEAHNLALQNWGYVAVVPGGWVRWAGYALAFGTVLPGVLLTAQVLDALGVFKTLQARPFNPGNWQPLSLLVGVALLILFADLVLGVGYLRQPLATLLMVSTTVLWAASMGLFIGTVARNEEQVIMITILAMLLLAGLGGAWIPLEYTGEAFQTVGRLTPAAWAINGLENIVVRGLGLASVLLPAAVLLGFSAAFAGLALWRFRFE